MRSFFLLATLNLALGGLVFLLGLLILRENPRQRLNRVVSVMLFFGGLGSVLTALSFLSTRPAVGAALAAATTTRGPTQNFEFLWEFFFPSLFLFASLFPAERSFTRKQPHGLLPRWAPSFELLVYSPHAFHFLLYLALTLSRSSLELGAPKGMPWLGPVVSMFSL